jgi:hypothetical protein
MDSRNAPALLDEELYKTLQEGLTKAFRQAVHYAENSGNSEARMRGAQATAQIAEALMRLQDRKPV